MIYPQLFKRQFYRFFLTMIPFITLLQKSAFIASKHFDSFFLNRTKADDRHKSSCFHLLPLFLYSSIFYAFFTETPHLRKRDEFDTITQFLRRLPLLFQSARGRAGEQGDGEHPDERDGVAVQRKIKVKIRVGEKIIDSCYTVQ